MEGYIVVVQTTALHEWVSIFARLGSLSLIFQSNQCTDKDIENVNSIFFVSNPTIRVQFFFNLLDWLSKMQHLMKQRYIQRWKRTEAYQSQRLTTKNSRVGNGRWFEPIVFAGLIRPHKNYLDLSSASSLIKEQWKIYPFQLSGVMDGSGLRGLSFFLCCSYSYGYSRFASRSVPEINLVRNWIKL